MCFVCVYVFPCVCVLLQKVQRSSDPYKQTDNTAPIPPFPLHLCIQLNKDRVTSKFWSTPQMLA